MNELILGPTLRQIIRVALMIIKMHDKLQVSYCMFYRHTNHKYLTHVLDE